MQPTLVILAAGIGSRYGGLKQVDSLGPGGQTIIDYSVYDALQAGFSKIVFVIRKSIEKDFVDVFSKGFLPHISYEFVFQELDKLPVGFSCPAGRTKPWGTAHALWVCRDVVKEPFVVINADDFYGREAYQMLASHLESNPPGDDSWAMCGYRLDKTLSDHGGVTRGICITDQEGYLLSVEEHKEIEKDSQGYIVSKKADGTEHLQPHDIVSMNIWAFNPSIFKSIENEFGVFLESHNDDHRAEMPIPTLIDQILAKGKGKVKVLQTSAQWFGVTYPEDKPQVSASLRELTEEGKYPEKMWK